jgi:hydroxyacylglutathione hydrolase
MVEADDGQLALVDTGFASSGRAILDELAARGATLSAILLTHAHRDHAGAATELRQATGARVCAGRADCLDQDGGLFVRPAVGRTRVGRWLLCRARVGHAPLCPVDLPIEGEQEVLPGIRAVPVPGHTPGSYCYIIDRLGAAFAGDLVISHSGELTRSMRAANHDDGQYLRSIRQFGAIAPGIGLPGHGIPVTAGFGDALRVLAELPRRPFTVGSLAPRAVRIARFGRGLSRQRPPTPRDAG